jgi:hypothetical protein
MAKEITYYGQLQPTGVDNSMTKRLAALAGLADQVQDIALQAGAERAQREGKRQGLTAGQTAAAEGQPLEKREGILSAFSIKDNAYNDAMESAYLSQVSVDSQEQMARIAAQYPDDVEAYGKAAQEARKGITSSIDPNYREVVGLTLDNVIQSYETKVFGNQVTKARASANESRLANIETLGRNAASFARDGDVLQSGAALVEVKAVLDSMVASNEFSQEEADSRYRPIVREAREQQIKHDLLKKVESEGYDAANEDLAALESSDEFTPDEFDAFKASAFTMLKREQAIEEASREVASKQEAEMVKDYIGAVSLGVSVDPSVTEEAKRAAANDPDLLEEFNQANTVAAFSVESFDNRDKQLQEARDAAENLENVGDYQALLIAQAQINSAVQKDPLAFANSQGIITLEPIDITNPSEFTPEAFATRIEQSKTAAAHYGVSVPPMTDIEVSQVAASINNMTPVDKIAFANTLSAAPEMWGELAGKNQQIFAQAGAMGNVDTQLAVFTGQDRLDKGLASGPSKLDYLSIFEDYVGDVYLTEDKASVMKTALAHYAGTQTPGEAFDSGLFRKSLRAVAGDIQKINGFKTALPPGVSQDSFELFVDNIDAEYIEIMGGSKNVTPSNLAKQIGLSRIKNIGTNKYIIQTNEKEDANGNLIFETVVKPDGEALEISYQDAAVATLIAKSQAKDRKATRQRRAVFNRGGPFFSGVEPQEDLLTIPASKRFTEMSMSEPIFGDSESQPSQRGIGSAPEGTADRLRTRLQSLKDGEDK